MIQHKIQIPSELLSSIFGTYDSNIRKIEGDDRIKSKWCICNRSCRSTKP